MTVKERILAIQVMEDAERDPAYAKRLGLATKLKEKEKSAKEEKI